MLLSIGLTVLKETFLIKFECYSDDPVKLCGLNVTSWGISYSSLKLYKISKVTNQSLLMIYAPMPQERRRYNPQRNWEK